MASILIVDDEAPSRLVLTRLLQLESFDVECAADGESALSMASKALPSVVVTDLALRGMDGVEVVRSFRGRGIPVIVATGDETRRQAAIDAGAADCLTKPIDFDELLLAIERCARSAAQ